MTYASRRIAAILPTACLLTLTAAALAQNEGTKGEPAGVAAVAEAKKPEAQVQVNLFGSHTFSADFTDSPGSVSVSRAGAEVSWREPIGDRSRLSLSLMGERSFYDFTGATGFVTGSSKPWEDTTQLSFSAVFSNQASEKWGWYFGGGADLSFEDSADIGKAFTFGIVGGVTYKVSDTLTLGGGAMLRSRLEDSGTFYPIANVDWKIAEKFRLSTETEVNSFGAGLGYAATEDLTISLRGAYEGRAFRLSDSGPAPSGVGREARIPVWVQVKYAFNPHASVTVNAGCIVWQQFTLDDSGGTEISKQKADPAPFISAGFAWVF